MAADPVQVSCPGDKTRRAPPPREPRLIAPPPAYGNRVVMGIGGARRYGRVDRVRRAHSVPPRLSCTTAHTWNGPEIGGVERLTPWLSYQPSCASLSSLATE